ncbi:MAG: hypothetical protein AAGI30_09270 [Planctomycetota bacterium]
MRQTPIRSMTRCLLVCAAVALPLGALGGCSTTPDTEDQLDLVTDAIGAHNWFRSRVPGLDAQIASSAGYIVFPGVAQWGLGISGGNYGRGVVYNSAGRQIGWAAFNKVSGGLQIGGQGFKMLMVVEDETTFMELMDNKLTGSASAVGVVGRGGGAAAPFDNGFAIYQGDNRGLIAGVNVGLDVLRYEPFVGGSSL